MKITVQYSCVLCGLKNVSLAVPARTSDKVNVKLWLEQTARYIGEDHQMRTPGCPSKSIQDLKIPVDGAEWIGGPTVQ